MWIPGFAERLAKVLHERRRGWRGPDFKPERGFDTDPAKGER
jgi:hypothetical protein